MDMVVLALAKKYTKDSLVGIGALKGSPCTIKSKTSITGGTRVTFAWEDTEGVEHTETVDLMNGNDGADGSDGADGVSVTGLSISGGHLFCTLSDGTSIDAGALPSGGAEIDDSTTALDKTWSSSKISGELSELSDSKVSLDKLSSDDFDVDSETGEISVIGGGGSGTSVVINPILSGDEETATSIKVGDEKYIFPNTNTYGFTPSQITMFEGILRAGTYSSDQSSAITAFIESLQTEPEPAELTSISATVTNLTVEQGQTYIPNATVTAFYSNGTSHDVTGQATFSTIDTSTTGEKPLTISYTEEGITKTDTKTVTVQSEPVVKTLSSISATKTKTSYNVDETYSNDDVVVTAQYSDSTSAVVTSSATIGTIDTSTAGDKTLNISYSEGGITKTTTIAIHVVSGGGEVIYTKSALTCAVTSDGQKFGDSHTPWVQGASYKYEFDYEVTALEEGSAVNVRDTNATYQFLITSELGATGHIEHTTTSNYTRERQAFVGKNTGYTIKLTNITITKLS